MLVGREEDINTFVIGASVTVKGDSSKLELRMALPVFLRVYGAKQASKACFLAGIRLLSLTALRLTCHCQGRTNCFCQNSSASSIEQQSNKRAGRYFPLDMFVFSSSSQWEKRCSLSPSSCYYGMSCSCRLFLKPAVRNAGDQIIRC